jgi:hypothetical protein
MYMKDLMSESLTTIDGLLSIYGASLDFPDEPEEFEFDQEDQITQRANLEYLTQMTESASFGKKMAPTIQNV